MGRPKRDIWINEWWKNVKYENGRKNAVSYKTAPEERIRQMRHELEKIEKELADMFAAVEAALGRPNEHPLTDIVFEHVANIRKVLKTTEGL